MENWLDLHMHSNISNDGEYSPEELVELCVSKGLKVISLTDHNSTKGIKRAKNAAKEIQFISGIELDCHIEGCNLHLLGYGIDETYSLFYKNEKNIQEQEVKASRYRLKKIEELGIKIDYDKVMNLSVDGIITGEMIAEAVLEDDRNYENSLLQVYFQGGQRSDNPYVNFYWDFCSQGKPAYIPIEYITLKEAIDMIKNAGGISILAHPGVNIGTDVAVLEKIIGMGIDGIEVFTSYHDSRIKEFYEEQILNHGLLSTIGSDFHGKIKPSIDLGEIECTCQGNLYTALVKLLS